MLTNMPLHVLLKMATPEAVAELRRRDAADIAAYVKAGLLDRRVA